MATGQEPVSTDNIKALVSYLRDKGELTQKPKFDGNTDISSLDWADLEELANQAAADPEKFKSLVGQEISVDITGYGKYQFRLIGVGHDKRPGEILTGLSFLCTKANIGGTKTFGSDYPTWASSTVKTFLENTVLKALPSGLQDIIKTVDKKFYTGSSISTTSSKMWIPSVVELTGGTTADGSKYAWFAQNSAQSNMAFTNPYWTRSNCKTSTAYYVDASGKIEETASTNSVYVLPGFCI